VLTASQGSATRYGFLETIRQYAAEQLGEAAETEARRRHAHYFAGLAERAEPELLGAEQRAWLRRLDDDHDNMRSALQWSVSQGEAELALRLCGGLRRFWWIRGSMQEGARWLAQALATPGASSERARARALNGAGALARSRGEYEQATALHLEALVLAERADDRLEVASATHYLGNVAADQGRFAEAEVWYVKSVALFRQLGDDWGTARALNNLGIVVRGQGDYARAAALCEESLAIRRARGDAWGVATSLDELARVARDLHDVEQAAELGTASLRLFHTLGVKRHIAAGLDIAAWTAGARGQHARAVCLYGAADGLREAIGSPALPCEQGLVARDLAMLRIALGPVRFDAAWAHGRTTSADEAVAHALTREPAESPATPAVALTRRECDVAQCIARGLSNREIAAELVISMLTVESHVRNILRKLGMERRGQVAVWAAEHGLASPPPGRLAEAAPGLPEA
jgi:non-specific serine/threonine protein kinase